MALAPYPSLGLSLEQVPANPMASSLQASQVELLCWASKSLQSVLRCCWPNNPGFSGLVCSCSAATKHAEAPAGHSHCTCLRACTLVQLSCKLPGGIGDALETLVCAGAVESKAAWQWRICNFQQHLPLHAWQQLAQPSDGSLEHALGEVWVLFCAVQGLGHLYNYLLPHCKALQLSASLTVPFIILRDGWQVKAGQVKTLATALTDHHGFWAVLTATCQASCLRVDRVSHAAL